MAPAQTQTSPPYPAAQLPAKDHQKWVTAKVAHKVHKEEKVTHKL